MFQNNYHKIIYKKLFFRSPELFENSLKDNFIRESALSVNTVNANKCVVKSKFSV
jgi:hypothetical protein